MKLRGVTLVELIVVVGIVGALLSLLLSAINSARETSRSIQCRNNLKQIGLGLMNHELAHGHFPSNGWGYLWVGEPEWGSGIQQPGGWIYSSLPFLEQSAIYNMPAGTRGEARLYATSRMLATPALVFHCPTRGRDALDLNYVWKLHNSLSPQFVFRSDYAGNAGSLRMDTKEGPVMREQALSYRWRSLQKSTGLFLPRFPVRARDVVDGLSHTYLVGEKSNRRVLSPWSFGDNQSAYLGDSHDIRRTCFLPPQRNINDDRSRPTFGSMHPAAWNMAFAGGAVATLSYDIDLAVHRRHACRDESVNVSEN